MCKYPEFIAYYARTIESDNNIFKVTIPSLSIGDHVYYKNDLDTVKDMEKALQGFMQTCLQVSEKGYRIYNKLDDVFGRWGYNNEHITVYKIRLTYAAHKEIEKCEESEITKYYCFGFEVLDIAYRNRPCEIYDIDKYIEEEERYQEELAEILRVGIENKIAHWEIYCKNLSDDSFFRHRCSKCKSNAPLTKHGREHFPKKCLNCGIEMIGVEEGELGKE